MDYVLSRPDRRLTKRKLRSKIEDENMQRGGNVVYKNWDDMTPEEREEFDAWENAFLDHIRQLQEEAASRSKAQMLNPARLKEIENALKDLKPILKPYMNDVKISVEQTALGNAGAVRITFPDFFETTNLSALCDALGKSDNIEIGIAFNKIYIDLCFSNLIQTTYLD